MYRITLGSFIAFALLTAVTASAFRSATQAQPAATPSAALFPFVPPWDDASPGVTNVSGWLDRPAGGRGFVVARDGHLYTGDRRLRFFGVNICFGACFPEHGDAEKVAARMAKFGINCVRFHHMDNQVAPNGIFRNLPTTDPRRMRALDPVQLDKLDYFISQLKRHGIYADLNLHVSRVYPGLPAWEGMPSYFKGVDNFHPAMITLQHEYARDLLTHRNPYTQTRYVEEPAVALVEINNENALLDEWWKGALDTMPAPYADELGRQWNAWLKAHYADAEALRRAWGTRAEPLGGELLANAGFARGTEAWTLEQHPDARAAWEVAPGAAAGEQALRVRVGQKGQESWHIQFHQAGLRLEPGRSYTLMFQARAEAPRRISVNAMQAHAPWRQLWTGEVRLTPAWQSFQFTFSPADGEENARISFSGLGAEAGDYWFAGVSLKPGGVLGLSSGETLGSVGLFSKVAFGSRTVAARDDWIRFLWDAEDRYWSGMGRFLKQELGAHALIVGTQMGYSPFPIQAKLDVIDSHAYWQHPRFPGRPWDPENWSVSNVSMVKEATGGTVAGLALRRPTGKPFIVTEYNHAAPNTYASEAFLLLAAYAGLQDWDGVFAFAYSHRRDDWAPRRIPSFFDIDAHPTKMATLPAAVALFTRGDVQAGVAQAEATMTLEEAQERVRRSGPTLRADAFGVPAAAALQHRVGLALGATAAKREPAVASAGQPGPAQSDNGELRWDAAQGVVLVDAPRSKSVIGFSSGKTYDLGGVGIAPAANRQNWSTISLTAVDAPDFASAGRVLITATGYAENTGMGWKNAEKSTVGRDWGTAPSLVEGIPATITLPVPAARVHVWALDERGQRKTELPVRDLAGKTAVEIGPRHQALWYELEVR
jgi:Carbohydrate binding domain